MKIIICGAGRVGTSIARQLASEGNDITVIDQSSELIGKLSERYDVRGIVGHASHPDVLESAGAEAADMLVAVTYADEVNMIACQVAHSIFNLPKKIARVRAQNYLRPEWSDLFGLSNLPIDVTISPEIEVARAIKRRLQAPGAFDMVQFAGGAVRAMGVHLGEDCPILHTPLRQLTGLFPDLHAIITAIIRNGQMVVPRGDDVLLPGDDIYFVSAADHVSRAMVLFGHEEKEARRVVIIGAGNIGLFLAQQIEESGMALNLKIIEADRNRAEKAADLLRKTVVLQGDALDNELLSQANAAHAESVITLTNDDEVNILAALLAKKSGCRHAIALVNNAAYQDLLPSLGVDVTVDPRATTISTILQHVRRGRIRSVYSVRDGEAEIMEGEVLETSQLAGQPIRNADLPEGIKVGALVRGNNIIIPRGDTVAEPGDRIVLFVMKSAIKKAEKIFSVKLEFF